MLPAVGRGLITIWVKSAICYCVDLLSGVESVHDRFSRAKRTHSPSQYGSVLKLTKSSLCSKKTSVLHTTQLPMYLDDRLMLELLGVGSAMEWRFTAMQKRGQLIRVVL